MLLIRIKMDGVNSLSDAEMRLISINGQTIMLEGDFENINMTNEFLNEMLMFSNSKSGMNDDGNLRITENSSAINIKETNDELTKLELSIKGDSNELETIQIGVEEAKALGLYFYGGKNEDMTNSWNDPFARLQEVKNNEGNINEKTEEEIGKAKFQAVPVLNIGCINREPETLVSANEITKYSDSVENPASFPLNVSCKLEKFGKTIMDDNNIESLPAIGHLEGFQIPTSEDGVLLPATVNAKMADGSYQTITLVPQIVNEAVMYTVHFSSLPKILNDKDLSSSLCTKEDEPQRSNTKSVNKSIMNNEINSVEEFLGSVNSVKKSNTKKNILDNTLKIIDSKNSISELLNSLTNESIIKLNKDNHITESSNEIPINYITPNSLPIDAKIDSLISENENVISRCKKVKYGKKIKYKDPEPLLHCLTRVAKSNITKAKKVKFKNKGMKFLSEETEQKKSKVSLLKPNSDLKVEMNNKKLIEATKNSNIMPHMNLNGRLEYPNLKAIDETAPLSCIKVKNSGATKQPYFNVLPCPKDKTIPGQTLQKQIIPLNCDLQQARNLISLQKFLETQKLQLKIQPIVSNGNKIINIRPKPTSKDEFLKSSADSTQVVNKQKEKELSSEGTVDKLNYKTQEDDTTKKLCQEKVNVKDGLLSDDKVNSPKFLKSNSYEGGGDTKEVSSECSNKINGIFIKNNPEYFNQKYKDEKADEHPLGSSENPIQLVQTGHTFHSRQPLSETQLRQIASILQKQKFDSPNIKKNSIFDPKTNTRIVYRVVYPEDIELKQTDDKNSAETINKRKRGRHRTKSYVMEDEILKKPSPLPRGPGRPKKSAVSALDEDVTEEEIEDAAPKKKIPRTRSGRLSRPPRYMVKDYKRMHNSDVCEKSANPNYESGEIYPPYHDVKKITLDGAVDVPDLGLETNLLPGLRPQQRSKRNFKPEYRCPTCQKIYLGHTRMMWHLNKFPDHCNVEKYKENYYRKRTETKVRRAARRLNMCDVTNKIKQVLNSMSKDELTSVCGPLLADALTTWEFLLLRVNFLKNTRKDEVDALLHELVILLEKLTKIADDIFLPVFSKEVEKDEDCVEIDRMEVAIALGLPVGFYKVNNDNLSLLRLPLKNGIEGSKDVDNGNRDEDLKSDSERNKDELFNEESHSWEDDKSEKKMEENSFWLERKVEKGNDWSQPESTMKTLSTKFEPNLSSKILESSNDSTDDGKYEESVPLMDLESNSKDVVPSKAGGAASGPTDLNIIKEKPMRVGEVPNKRTSEEKPSLWNESSKKVSTELWNGSSEREKWEDTSDMVQAKSSSELWSNDNSGMTTAEEKSSPNLWNENSNLTSSEKVDETNSEFLDSLLSVPNSNEFLANESGSFLSENIELINEKSEEIKANESVGESKEKEEWRSDESHNNYMRVWDAEKNPAWSKEEPILSNSLQDRMPGARTTTRLTSTPETNANIAFSIPTRRNSISDFTNISLESGNLDMVLPPAKTLIKDCLKSDERKFDLKEGSFPSDFKVKNWQEDSTKQDFTTASVNSEDLMKMALESFTSQHDVINVPTSSFDSAMGILNQNQESGNLNLFAGSETDALDFNLPLPDHLLRTNFAPTNFQHSESSPFLSTGNNIFGSTSTLSNSIKFDQFETNFTTKKSKSLDDVMEFFDAKTPFNGYGGSNENGAINNFSFDSTASHEGGYTVPEPLDTPVERNKKKQPRLKKLVQKRSKTTKKAKTKKVVDYPKSNTIESIINEALFDTCAANAKPLQMENSSPNGSSTIPNSSENYSLPIISGSLDEVENLDFLNQD